MNRKMIAAVLAAALTSGLGSTVWAGNTMPALAEDEFLTGKYTAELTVKDYGTITMELDADAAPITVTNFYRLCQQDFYDGLTFHRIMEGFMMQGGDPLGNGTGGSDQNIKGEFSDNGVDNPLSHTKGAVSMARSQSMDSASSQFFICHEDATFLDGQYACFGYVTEGQEIVDKVCTDAKPTDGNGTIKPDEQPMIEDIVFTDTELTTIPASEVDAEVVSTKLKFTAENLEGEEVSFEDFDGTKLMIINFWEPWCGPCVEEMPDLDKLYKNYKDKGLAVVGVFADLDQLEEAREIIEEEGISYPILKDNGEFARFARDYVPSTVFVDGQGNLLTAEPLVGALKYEEWESIVSQVLS